MKKILFAIAIVMMLGFTASAQRGGTDGFFNYNENTYGFRGEGDMTDPNSLINLPGGGFGGTQDQNLPLGSGLLVLTALGAGYAVYRKRNK